MQYRREIDTIVAQVTPWPEEDRVALAYAILRDARRLTRQPAPRKTLSRALGIAAEQAGFTTPLAPATSDAPSSLSSSAASHPVA